MRKSILLFLLLTACSGDGEEATYHLVPDFADRATPMACAPVDLGEVAIQELRSATDTSFVVLDAAQRRVTEFSDGLRPIWSLEYDEYGPAALNRPVSAALLADSAVAIVASGGVKLVILGRDGRLIHAQRLDFVPHAVAATGDELLITTVPMGGSPGSLLFRFRGGAMEEVAVPPREYADMLVGALGNQAAVETLADGDALVVHRVLAPRAFRVAADRAAVAPVAVPTPDATAERIAFVPRAPVTTAQAGDMLVPALAMSVDRSRDEVYLLTRSGREVDGRWQRAILRTDDHLGFLGAYTLDPLAVHMAILPRRRAALVGDDLDRVYLCPLDADTYTE